MGAQGSTDSRIRNCCSVRILQVRALQRAAVQLLAASSHCDWGWELDNKHLAGLVSGLLLLAITRDYAKSWLGHLYGVGPCENDKLTPSCVPLQAFVAFAGSSYTFGITIIFIVGWAIAGIFVAGNALWQITIQVCIPCRGLGHMLDVLLTLPTEAYWRVVPPDASAVVLPAHLSLDQRAHWPEEQFTGWMGKQ